ncbi:RHS repeat domain-containing protein [Capnocytophaga sputigena]|uniref:RHS repeat domain-containing protein n=1 Tax=Capnocytophaga sputigena TaxID=1019 RepID=UPI00391F0995
MISDHLGTPILAVDSEGNEVWNRQLDIYGRVRHEFVHPSFGGSRDQRVCERGGFPFIPFLYQGQYYDFETNLAYNRFRYYSPETGAYISQDPIGLAGGNPTLYGYVKDSNWWVDVFGLDDESDDVPTHLHHTIPREIYNPRSGGEPLLPPHLANDPDIKGKAGNPNRWEVPANEHIALHKKNRPGGEYNDRWKSELEALREEKDKSEWTKEDILSIRDKLTKEFNIDKYNPKNKKDCTE